MKKIIFLVAVVFLCQYTRAQQRIYGPGTECGCTDATSVLRTDVEYYNNGNRRFQKISLTNNSSKAVLIMTTYTSGQLRNSGGELTKVLAGQVKRFRLPADGNWYAIVMYLSDACKSCPEDQETGNNESNDWNTKCLQKIDKELCKKYFDNCY